jgi:hypothetical protein
MVKKRDRRLDEALYLNLDDFLDTPKNRVSRIGVELEGGWNVLPKGVNLDGDGSVFKGRRVAGIQYGELPFGPVMPAAVPKFIKKYYPQHIDKTCGMHIHMSFKNLLRYSWLMAQEYQETLIHYLSKWANKEGFPRDHYIWERLAGKNTFCQKKFWPDEQVKNSKKEFDQTKDGHRYTIVHYCGRLRTIEVRALPMMATPEQAIRATQMVIDITNASLVALCGKEERVVNKLELPNGWVYEQFMEEEIPLTSQQRKKVFGL